MRYGFPAVWAAVEIRIRTAYTTKAALTLGKKNRENERIIIVTIQHQLVCGISDYADAVSPLVVVELSSDH
jgi:hypothetical protein